MFRYLSVYLKHNIIMHPLAHKQKVLKLLLFFIRDHLKRVEFTHSGQQGVQQPPQNPTMLMKLLFRHILLKSTNNPELNCQGTSAFIAGGMTCESHTAMSIGPPTSPNLTNSRGTTAEIS